MAFNFCYVHGSQACSNNCDVYFAFIALLSSIKPEHYYDVDMLESIKKDKPIKTGDCISPNRGQWMTDEEFGLSESHRKERNKIKVNDSDYADVRAMATKVHADKYETVIKR